jgi:hypothetical protein
MYQGYDQLLPPALPAGTPVVMWTLTRPRSRPSMSLRPVLGPQPGHDRPPAVGSAR